MSGPYAKGRFSRLKWCPLDGGPADHGDIARGRWLVCEACGRAVQLAAGGEFVLEQVELEVP